MNRTRTIIVKTLCFLFIIFLIVIGVLVFMSTSAKSEDFNDFTYRNGIKFGNACNDILEKEIFNKPKVTAYEIAYDNVELSGIARSTLLYRFTNGKLDTIKIYYLNDNKDTDKQIENYLKIENGLNRKYGDGYTLATFENCRLDKYLSEKFEILFNSERVINYGDKYAVVIDHDLIAQKEDTETLYIHYLNYSYKPNIDENEIVDSDL